MEKLNWPLMENNITEGDLNSLIEFLKSNPRLTQGKKVEKFEEKWSEWLGVKYSVFVNSGSSANLITMGVLKELVGEGEIVVPPLTWVSDIASILHNNFIPVFADISLKNLGMDTNEIIKKITDKTRAVFITYVQGFNCLTEELLSFLKEKNIVLIEDVCESHGATFNNRKLGTFGLMSNFSFYFAHHMSTIEGGMVCTNNEDVYEMLRAYRSHGLVREIKNENNKMNYLKKYKDLSPEFIFLYPAYNVRNTEIGAVLGLSQLKKLDENNEKRNKNFEIFLNNLDNEKYFVDFDLAGSCNYAFNLLLKEPDIGLRDRVEKYLKEANVEFRRGSSGGGNQLRQPYLRKYLKNKNEYANYPNAEHVHFFGWYIGNYPELQREKILKLCEMLNKL